jgi:hypothetical protein
MIKVWKYAISTTWTNCPPIKAKSQYSVAKYGGHVTNDISKKNIA